MTWPDKPRYELIEGVPYAMAAAPSREHQRVSRELLIMIGVFLKGKTCEVYGAPFDVVLNDKTVVEPDIVVVCDPSKLTDKGCTGAPDFIIEILSPGSSSHDKIKKLELYRKCGVREYWIIDPIDQTVIACILTGSEYIVRTYGAEDRVPVTVIDGLVIDMAEVFPATQDRIPDASESKEGYSLFSICFDYYSCGPAS